MRLVYQSYRCLLDRGCVVVPVPLPMDVCHVGIDNRTLMVVSSPEGRRRCYYDGSVHFALPEEGGLFDGQSVQILVQTTIMTAEAIDLRKVGQEFVMEAGYMFNPTGRMEYLSDWCYEHDRDGWRRMAAHAFPAKALAELDFRPALLFTTYLVELKRIDTE